MFHISFCANEAYAKYTAVLITSIIKSTDSAKRFRDFFATNERERERESLNPKSSLRNSTNSHLDFYPKRDYDSLSDDEKREGYIFHIISDFLSDDSRTRFTHLAKDLAKIYPCEIYIHICDDKLFSGLPRLNDNYLTYFRFFIPRFMPPNCVSCLYLDIDMLVVGDLRELFALDMGEKCVGVVSDYAHNSVKLRPKSANLKDIYFSGTYFNSGFLLLNLRAWEQNRITERCFEVMAHYHLNAHDQDVLNAVIADFARLKLPFAFNLLVRAYICAHCKGESLRYKFDFTRSAMNLALKNPVVWHFAGHYKPWHNAWIMNEKGRILSAIWWEVALKTPRFADILQSEFEQLGANSDKIFENRVAIYLLKCVKNFLGFFALPFVVAKIFGKNKQEILESHKFGESSAESCDLRKLSPSDYNFAFELFYLCQKSWQRRKRGDLLILPIKAIKLKIRHNRYGINRITNNL